MTDAPAIALAALGGTIAMQRGDDEALTQSREAVDRLIALARHGSRAVRRLDVDPKPGPHVSESDMIRLAESIEAALAAGCTGAVVTHGTDTLEETAFALDLLVAGDAPVVVTGAMTAPDAPGADGPANLADALAVAADPRARGQGALAVLNATIHPAATLGKRHTFRHDAFRAGDGALGEVVEGRPVFTRRAWRSPTLPARPDTTSQPVPLIAPAAGDNGQLVDAALAAGVPAIVLAAFGGGHVPPPMLPALSRATRRIPVVIASRCGGGGTLSRTYGYEGAEVDLIDRGMILAGRLPPPQARLATSLLCRTGAEPAAIADFLRCFGAAGND